MPNLDRQLRVGFILVPAGLAIQLFAVLLLARHLGPESWGVFAVVLAAMILADNISELGVGTVVTKMIAEQRLSARDCIAISLPPVIVLSLVCAALQAVVLCAAYSTHLVGGACVLAGLNILMFGSSMVLSCAVRGLGRINRWQFGFFAQKVIQLLVVVLLVRPLGGDLTFSMASWTIANVVTLLYFAFALWPNDWRGELRWDRRELRRLVADAVPVGGITILSQLAAHLETFLLAAFTGASSVGLFNVAHRILNPARTIMNGTIITPTFPAMCALREVDAGRFRRFVQRLVAINWIAGLVLSAAAFTAAPLLPWLLGEKYVGSAPILRTIVWTLPPAFLALQARFINVSLSHQRRFLVISAMQLLVKAVLLTLLIRWYGLWGACVGALVAELMLAAAALLDLRLDGKRLPISADTVVATAAAGLIVCITLFVPNATWLGWASTAIGCAVGLSWLRRAVRSLEERLPSGASHNRQSDGVERFVVEPQGG